MLSSASSAALMPISRRYRLLDAVAFGGMGAVYRAYDRLTGDTVALKRLLPADMLPGSPAPVLPPHTATHTRTALVQEFQTMASLRHPHIVRVLDYGFDRAGQPFFTMELLSEPQTILGAAAGLPLTAQVRLLVQLLSALSYVHRRRILHRDLKPANVLVSDGQVKVLDFGIATLLDSAAGETGYAGTLHYMAPELLEGKPASPASDLYAVGVIAFEMLYGRHPFDTEDVNLLIQRMFSGAVRFDGRTLDLGLIDVLSRLLALRPNARYPSAAAVIEALQLATRQSLSVETHAVRESFLQAARLVGREAELARIGEAVRAAQAERGAVWLVRGESGVGKSRLMNEARIAGLVSGALVVTGQAVADAGGPYHVWEPVIRRLALEVELPDDIASVLQTVAAGLGDVLERPIPPPPELDPQTAQSRLFLAVLELIRRLPTPALIVLEDLHWADAGSLALLAQMTRAVADMPVLVLGTARADEAFDLPPELRAAPRLDLARLSREEIAGLSEAMLGTAGLDSRLVALLERETEGNAFFLIEVVRALAADVGQLSQAAAAPVPPHFFTGGVQSVIRRRLERVPAEIRPVLECAAVVGRELDPVLLGAMLPGQTPADLETHFAACEEIWILEFRHGRWRFAHDKLREGILFFLDTAARRQLHRRAALAIEATAADHLASRYADLAYHWRQAGDAERERQYARLAGEQAAARFANTDAVQHLSRTLELTPEHDVQAQVELLLRRERIFHLQGQRDLQQRDLEALDRLAADPSDEARCADLKLRWAEFFAATAQNEAAIRAAHQAIAHSQAAGAVEIEVRANLQHSEAFTLQGHYERAWAALERALKLSRQLSQPALTADVLRGMGKVRFFQDAHEQAERYFLQAQQHYRAVGDSLSESRLSVSLGVVKTALGRIDEGRAEYLAALDVMRTVGDRVTEATLLFNLGMIAQIERHFRDAQRYTEAALARWRDTDARISQITALINLSWQRRTLGDYAGADADFEQGRTMAERLDSRLSMGWLLSEQAARLLQEGDISGAVHAAESVLAISAELNMPRMAQDALTTLGNAALEAHDEARAADYFARAAEQPFPDYFKTRRLEILAGQALIAFRRGDAAYMPLVESLYTQHGSVAMLGADNPMHVYLILFRLLSAVGDPRAPGVLSEASRRLERWATTIDDPRLRRSFLNDVPLNREVRTLAALYGE